MLLQCILYSPFLRGITYPMAPQLDSPVKRRGHKQMWKIDLQRIQILISIMVKNDMYVISYHQNVKYSSYLPKCWMCVNSGNRSLMSLSLKLSHISFKRVDNSRFAKKKICRG
jgi:hypothetical protein